VFGQAMATLRLSVGLVSPMALVDWIWIVHPVLAVVLIYPLTGIVIRLAMQTRSRRLKTAKPPPTVGRDHSDLGRWLAAGVVGIVIVALIVAIATHAPLDQFQGGFQRACTLLLVLVGTLLSVWALWIAKAPGLRRLHVTANVLAALLFVAQGITGTRDLLEIPLSWQKPTIYGCNFQLRTCPPFAPLPLAATP